MTSCLLGFRQNVLNEIAREQITLEKCALEDYATHKDKILLFFRKKAHSFMYHSKLII